MRLPVIATLRSRLIALTACVALLTVSAGCGDDDDDTPAAQSITDIVINDTNFSVLEAAVVRAGLADALRGGTLTVFAPTNAAFQAAGITETSVGTTDVNVLRNILQYHVLSSRVGSADIQVANNTAVKTLGGPDVYVTKTQAGRVFVNGAEVTTADQNAANGVIHVINRVLMPPPATNGTLVGLVQSNTDLSLLRDAVTRVATADPTLATTLTTGTYTIFAPTNAAFTAAGFGTTAAINAAPIATLRAVLLNHVVTGRVFSSDLPATGNVAALGGGQLAITSGSSGVTVRSPGITTAANVTGANMVATNGVVHVVDRVLLP